jgi:hypothetical protein
MSYPRQLYFPSLTVLIATSLSVAVDLDAYHLVGFVCPAAIEATTTNVSFTASPTLAGTYNIVKPNGIKLSIPFLINDYITLSNIPDLYGVRFIKFQMETAAGVAVAQATAARIFTLILEPI